jgi:hypothetical protein
MSRARALAVLTLLFMAACGGEPPDKEMQQAQGAIDAARAAGADVYAVEEFAAAQAALKRAEDAAVARDYRLALDHALDSRQRAQNAAKLAADGMASARVEADRALTAAVTSANTLRTRLKAPDAQRLPARTLTAPRQALADGDRLVQEARAALDRGDYRGARETATGANTALAAARAELDAAITGAARRRR